jgi:protein Mpv17
MVVKKVLVDQVVASPIVIAMFFATLGVMRQESLDETMEEIKHKFLRLYKAEWIVWPTAQVINFWILPNRFRVLYDNTISLGYVINEPIPIPSTSSSPQKAILTEASSRMVRSVQSS